jgi:alkylhydroperoxidase family enzyme
MPRLRQVPRAEVTSPIVTEWYNALFGPDRDPVAQPGTRTGTPGNWWTVFALVPDILDHAGRGFRYYANPNRLLDPKLRELGQTRAGWAVGSQFVYSQHCKSCRGLGMPEDKIDAIKEWQVSPLFDEQERAILAFVDYLVQMRGRMPEAIMTNLKRFLTDEQIMELTYTTCLYDMHAVITKALRLEFDDRDDPIVEVAAPKDYTGTSFLDTSTPPPTPR